MNDSRFDDIARRLARAGGLRGSRRGLLKAGAAIGLGSAIADPDHGGAAPTAGPPARAAARPQTSPDQLLVQQIAFDLDYDPDKICRFVADEIAYESYDGALRGVRGTLWSGAGNSVDQSQLLVSLLTEAMVDLRYAVGSITDADAVRLVEAMAARRTPSQTLENARAISRAAEADAQPSAPAGTPVAGQPESDEVVDRVAALREQLFAEASQALSNDVTEITKALSDAGVDVPSAAPSLAQTERERHIWVQIRQGAEWVDVDPSFTGSDIGQTPAKQTGTLADLPEEWFHTVSFRVVAEIVAGDATVERAMLDLTRRSQDLVGEDVIISHIEPEGINAVGAGLNEALGGQIAYYPFIMLGAEGLVADAFLSFGSGGGILSDDVLGGGEGTGEGECLAEYYEIEVTSPGATSVRSRRTLFDRVPSAQREAGNVDLSQIPTVAAVDLGWEKGLLEVSQIVALAVVSSAVDADYLGRPLGGDDALSSFTGAIHGMHALRESLERARGDSNLYLDRPNVTAFNTVSLPAVDGVPRVRLDADLLHQGYGARGRTDGTTGIYAGVLAQKAERLALDRRLFGKLLAIGATPSIPELNAADVGAVFAAAAAEGAAILVLTDADHDEISSIGVESAVRTRIEQSLDQGKVVVIPARTVQIDGMRTIAWWVFDPVSGTLHDQLADGRSGATLVLGPMADYMTAFRVWLRANKGWIALGACIAAIARAAASIIGTEASARSVLNVGGNVGGALATCGTAAAAGA